MIMAHVSIPKSLSSEQKELFNKLSETLGKEVIPQREKSILRQIGNALGDFFGASYLF